jgi:hypothetical protein
VCFCSASSILFDQSADSQLLLTLTASKPDPAGLEAKEWGSITKIAWKEEMPGMPVLSEKGAKSRAINLCNYLLNCET